MYRFCSRLMTAVLFGLLPACLFAADSRPNLLLITADDLGIQLGCYGDPQARTPRLDEFARQAVRFEVAYVAQASCSPSRSAMLTGFYPHANGQYGLANALSDRPMNEKFRLHESIRQRVLPRLLKAADYRTGVIGKLHVNPESAFPFDVRIKTGFGDRAVSKQAGFVAQFIAESGDQPWFLMANLFDPHVSKRVVNGKRRGGTFFPTQIHGIPANPRIAADMQPFPFQQIDHPNMLERVAGYYNCVERADAGIGMMLDRLAASGQADHTIVVIIGDHGPPVGRGKTTCYEAGLRIPFLVRWPGVSTPHVSEKMVSTVDIVPTFLDACSLEIPPDLQGRSLRPILSGDSDVPWRDNLFAEFQFHGDQPYVLRRCVRNARYKLIHNPNASQSSPHMGVDACPSPGLALALPADSQVRQAFERIGNPPEFEFYDLEMDPWEFNNLAGQPEFANVQAEMLAAIDHWRDETEDPFRDPEFVKTVPGQSD